MLISPAALWVVAGVILCILEIFTAGFFVLWFGIGAFVAAAVAAAGLHLPWQLVVFAVVSLTLLVFTRRFFLKVVTRDGVKTNVDALIGEEGVALSRIQREFMDQGQVKVKGEIWSAVCEEGSIEPGEIVEVMRVTGVKLVVKRKEDSSIPGRPGMSFNG